MLVFCLLCVELLRLLLACYTPFGVLAVVFFMLYFFFFLTIKEKNWLSMCVCVSGKTQLYLLVVPDGNRRHFHLANIAGVWYILWFCGCFVPIALKFDSICTKLLIPES